MVHSSPSTPLPPPSSTNPTTKQTETDPTGTWREKKSRKYRCNLSPSFLRSGNEFLRQSGGTPKIETHNRYSSLQVEDDQETDSQNGLST